MATSSFLKEVVIKDAEFVCRFVDAMSKSAEESREEIAVSRPCRELKGKEIREFFEME